jgi:hypothetical protein
MTKLTSTQRQTIEDALNSLPEFMRTGTGAPEELKYKQCYLNYYS